MALCKEEGTEERVLELFGKGGVIPGYVVIFSWELQKENPGKDVCHFSCVYRCYGSKEVYKADIDNFFHHGGIGGPIPKDACKNCDDRDVLYPYIQAEIQRLDLWQLEKIEFEAAKTEEEKTMIREKYASQISEVYSKLNIVEI